MARNGSQRRVFRPGDAVLVRFGVDRVPATVLEDRGLLGVGGRRIYRVRVTFEEPLDFEAPEEDVAPGPRRPAAA